MTRAFNVAKRVRTETEIGSSAVSVSYAAVELARDIFGELSSASGCCWWGRGRWPSPPPDTCAALGVSTSW